MCLALDGRRYRGPDPHACQRAYRSVRGPRTQWRAMGVAGAHRGRYVLRPTATKLGAKIRDRVAAASERANAAFQRSKSSIVAAPFGEHRVARGPGGWAHSGRGVDDAVAAGETGELQSGGP